jgi:DNA polymerase-3 subunit delta'
MAFRDVVGQEQALQILHKALSSSRLAHAYLFHGPSGVGKKFTAWQFVKALYCDTASIDACDCCVTCRKIMTGHHPDVMLISAEDSSIKIEQVRALQRHLSYKPYENQRTSVIIDRCELFTPPAANALLKTLEEPPANALLLLLAGNKDALPLTITSRCQLVPFRPLPPVHLRTLLERQGIAPHTAALAASLVEGRLDRFNAADFSQLLAIRQNAYQVLHDVVRSQGMASFLQARKLAGKREQCAELLRWLALLCRDLTMLKAAPDMPLYNQDLRTELSALVSQVALEPLLNAFSLLQQLSLYLTMNLNAQLLFEHLLVQLPQTLAVSPASSSAPSPAVTGGKQPRKKHR